MAADTFIEQHGCFKVDWCCLRAEACPQGYVDLKEIRILAVVGDERCENHLGRKGKGSFSLYIREGLVMPNFYPNWNKGKGKQVNIPVL